MARPYLTKAYSKYGASMGRRDDTTGAEADRAYKMRMCVLHLDSGGYDSGGAYWGTGDPLYQATSDCGELTLYFRSTSRNRAKDHVRKTYPNVRFYR